MMKKLYAPSTLLDVVAMALTAAGLLSWSLGRLFGLSPVRATAGGSRTAERAAYGVVGLSGLWLGARLAWSLLRSTAAAAVAVPVIRERSTVYPVARTIVGQRLPRLRGETLSWKRITLPDDARGQVTLLALGFTYGSRRDVQAWTRAFRGRFGGREDVTFFEIPIIRGLARLATHYIELGMQHEVSTEMWDHVLTVYGSTKAIRESFGATMASPVWVYLVDKAGVVRFQCAGEYDSVLFQELSAATQVALGIGREYRIDLAE